MNITKASIQPLRNFILVEPITRPESTDSGFVMPDSSYVPTPIAGIVLACGKDCKEVSVGDIVFFRRFSIDELKFTIADGSQETASIISEEELVSKTIKK